MGSVTMEADRGAAVRAGLIGGLAGGVIVWIYEAVVWVGWQHQMPFPASRATQPAWSSARTRRTPWVCWRT